MKKTSRTSGPNEKETRVYRIYQCPTCLFFSWSFSDSGKIGTCSASTPTKEVYAYDEYTLSNPPPDCQEQKHAGKRVKHHKAKTRIKRAPKKALPKNGTGKGRLFQ